MLSEKELLQNSRRYELVCPICETKNSYFQLKRDMARPLETEGDGHPHNSVLGSVDAKFEKFTCVGRITCPSTRIIQNCRDSLLTRSRSEI